MKYTAERMTEWKKNSSFPRINSCGVYSYWKACWNIAFCCQSDKIARNVFYFKTMNNEVISIDKRANVREREMEWTRRQRQKGMQTSDRSVPIVRQEITQIRRIRPRRSLSYCLESNLSIQLYVLSINLERGTFSTTIGINFLWHILLTTNVSTISKPSTWE